MSNINEETVAYEKLKVCSNTCNLCPHKCNVNRDLGKKGRCKAPSNIKIALVSLHKFEEPCISGTNGSGTIFFSHCNLQCKFCQNYEISSRW